MSSETAFNLSIGEERLNPINDLPEPSNEQIAIIEGAKTGRNIKVQAFAGTGKTTTIKMLAQVLLESSAYIAFNRDIVDEVSNKLPDHVWCSTAHRLAFKEVISGRSDMEAKFNDRSKLWYHSNVSQYIGGEIDKKLLAIVIRMVKNFCKSVDAELTPVHIGLRDELTLQKMTASEVETLILLLVQHAEDNRRNDDVLQNIKNWYNRDNAKPKPLISKYLSLSECQELIQKTIKNAAAYSATDPISEEDFPAKLLNKIKSTDTQRKNEGMKKELLVQKLMSRATNLWNEITDPCSDCAIDFDVFLKMWQLGKPQIDAKVIYIDEAQDLDPVMLDVLQHQKAQMIWLGDAYQQIYAWRGAINALATLENCLEFQLTETFRFNPSIASFANMALKILGESRQIKSNKKPETDKATNHAVISRTNATLFDMAFSLAQDGKHFAWSDKNFKPDTLINHCKELVKIDSGREAFMDMYKEFTSIADIELFLEEENNDSIARPLALCKRFNFNLTSIKAAVKLISRFIDPTASIVLTTAHKSKGQEWDKVTLCDDFSDAIEREKRNRNGTKYEWNLLYVAFTRAKKELSLLDSIKLLLGVLPPEENLRL
jgi:hypothetical protein